MPLEWTPEQIETLTRMWVEEQAAASAIASTLGTTREAVLGKLHRLGLQRKPQARSEPPGPSTVSAERVWDPQAGGRARVSMQPLWLDPEAEPADTGPPTSSVEQITPMPLVLPSRVVSTEELRAAVDDAELRQHPTLLQLRAHQCRFPLGTAREPAQFFCGKPRAPGRPYCEPCCTKAYVTAPARRR